MATQKRYREYKTPIGSKDSMEPLAIVNGIGPVFGFNVATVDANLSKLTLSSLIEANKTSKYRYLANKTLSRDTFNHGVITPDGILTTFTGNLELAFNAASFGSYKELLVVATHRYLENDGVENTTTLAIYPNTTSVSMVTKMMEEQGTGNGVSMGSFIAAASLVHVPDEINESIIGVYSIDTNNLVTPYIPYGYEWPETVRVPKSTLSRLTDIELKAAQLANSLLSKELSISLNTNRFIAEEGSYNFNYPSNSYCIANRVGKSIILSFRLSMTSTTANSASMSINLSIPLSTFEPLFDSASIMAPNKLLPISTLSDLITRLSGNRVYGSATLDIEGTPDGKRSRPATIFAYKNVDNMAVSIKSVASSNDTVPTSMEHTITGSIIIPLPSPSDTINLTV